MNRKYSFIAFLLCISFSVSAQEILRLVTPADNHQTSNNMPVLSWTSVPSKEYRIFIDGIHLGSVPGTDHSWVPFALSFGVHEWYVVAETDKGNIRSTVSRFTIDDDPVSDVPADAFLIRHGWLVQSVESSGLSGSTLTTNPVSKTGWLPTTLPATVLTVFVRNGMYPNPVIGLNNMKIPDLNDEYNQENDLLKFSHLPGKNPWNQPYWYINEFNLTDGIKGSRQWLNLGEINYKGEIWFNGTRLADSSTVKGMERSFRFDVTGLVNRTGKNRLAIMIFPPDHPGKPAPDPVTPLADPGTNMADGMISRDYTKWDALGWDWQPPVRDRDMGITEDVWISGTEDIEIIDFYVTANLNLPDTTSASLTASATIINHSNSVQNGALKLNIRGYGKYETVKMPYSVQAGDSLAIQFQPESFPTLNLKGIRLWWPAGYGGQPLYDVTMTADFGGFLFFFKKETQVSIRHGFRKVETKIGKKERTFTINGRDIYLRGGNWVTDWMLNWTSSRYKKEIALSKHANLNILRIWGPTGVAPRPFYEAADEQGVLLWQDFLNDFWGTFKNTPGYQPPEPLFLETTTSIVKKYRNHPSLIMWCGGNEGPNPREDLIVNHILKTEDSRSGRFYLKQSDGDGLHGGGPYHTMEPWQYFVHPKLNGFSSEIGPSGIPEVESVYHFMPDRHQTWMPGRFPLDGTWAFHDANDWPGTDTRKFTSFDTMLRNYYGAPDTTNLGSGFTDYLRKCQIINYDVYRASLESINRQLWDQSSGILLWKSNSSWPSLAWQVYDWYLHAHAGFYSTRRSSSSFHIQYNRNDRSVVLMNLGFHSLPDVSVSAVGYDKNLKVIWKQDLKVLAESNGVSSTGINVPEIDDLAFLKLTASHFGPDRWSDNFYWLNPANKFNFLSDLPTPDLQLTSRKVDGKSPTQLTVTVENTGQSLIFMGRLQWVATASDVEFTPSFWSDNYLFLLPGEKKTINVSLEKEDLTAPSRIKMTVFGSDIIWYSEIK